MYYSLMVGSQLTGPQAQRRQCAPAGLQVPRVRIVLVCRTEAPMTRIVLICSGPQAVNFAILQPTRIRIAVVGRTGGSQNKDCTFVQDCTFLGSGS
jgi:hypothetical protein